MHPAPSIIVFTVLSGLGYGLALVLSFGLLDPTVLSTKIGWISSLLLISIGLLASTLHLGNPQRAWRAFSQWRSSWLSREAVCALLTFIPLLWSCWAVAVEGRYAQVANGLTIVGALATLVCTSMIYTQLKSVDAWHTPLTPLCFVLFALTGGLVTAGFFGALGQSDSTATLLGLGALSSIVCWIAKWQWRRRLKELDPTSTTASATQLGVLGAVRQFEPPHTTANYLTSEMMFRVGRKHADRLFAVAIILGGVTATILLGFATLSAASGAWILTAIVSVLAALCHLSGVMTERWLFFAEARHAVSSFYGS